MKTLKSRFTSLWLCLACQHRKFPAVWWSSIAVSFRRCDWLFPPSEREVSPENRSNYKSTRERVDSKGLYGRWRLHLMGSCCLSFSHKLWPQFWNRWISRIGSLRFCWNSVQRKALMRTMCSREIFTKKRRQQQIFDSDLKGAWHYNHVTFTPIAKNFMLYRRLIYMLSNPCVRFTIKVKMGIPASFKVGWYPPKKTGSSHLNTNAREVH